MRIVQLANFYGPRSGGLRTALHHLGAGYAGRGHEVVDLATFSPRHHDDALWEAGVPVRLPDRESGSEPARVACSRRPRVGL